MLDRIKFLENFYFSNVTNSKPAGSDFDVA